MKDRALSLSVRTAVFLTTFSGLVFEIGLTRIYSATIWYHFAFVAISMALLGWGLGGLIVHLLKKSWPPSLERAHNDYLAAVRLFQQSAVEVLKMFDDGNDEHLLAAYPMSREGSDKIREIGAKFWEDEFPPH